MPQQQQQDHLQQQQQQHEEYEEEEEESSSSSSIPNSPTFSPTAPSQKSYPFIPKKTKKPHNKDNPISPLDLISPLPDPILSHILSFLPSEDALSTSSLSKRWLHLWATLPRLSFRSNLHWNNGLQPFISLLNGVLRRYGPCNLITFHLHFDYSTAFADRLSVWLRFVTNRNVEHIELNLYGDQDLYPLEVEHYKLPQYLFDYVNLRVLRVRFCEVAPSREITWGRLRVLSIGYARLSDELVRRVLGGSPVLEDLELYKCGRISCLDLRGCLSLKRLVVYDYWDSSDFVDGEVLEIFGGGLRSLGLLGFLYRKKVKVRDVSRLVDVEIDFELMTEVDGVEDHNDYEEYRGMLLDILENVHSVEELTVGTWCLELLSICELKGFHSPLLKCKHLILNTCISAWDLPGVANLLRASPDVETFVINMRCSFSNEFAYSINFITTNSFDEKSYWTAKEEESKSWLLKLRTIKIVGFIADGGETNLVLLLVQFLLKKAQALERVIIDIHNRHPNRWWRHSKPEDILKIEKCIESFPRSSPQVKITLRHMSDS